MPEMDGFELADAMHAAPRHLAKPFTMAELRVRVAQFSKS
jgi:hypothetical protein